MKLAAALLTGLALAGILHAWPTTDRGFVSLDYIPAFAVCTVEQVIKLNPVSAAEKRFPWPERRFESRVLIHRVFFQAPDRPFEPGTRLAIYYNNPEEPLPGGGGEGSFPPPIILKLQVGQTVLVPLTLKSGRWTLQWDESWNPVVEALAAEPTFADSPGSGRAFVFRELAQLLARGSARQRNRAAEYLTGFAGDVPSELPRLLAAAFGSDDDVWLEAGCAFLGVPDDLQRNNTDLLHGEASPPFHDVRQLVTWVLKKGDRRDYPNRLIRCLLRNTGAYAWGAARTLIGFRDSGTLIDELNVAMRRNRPGSITVAREVVNAGQRAVLPEGLELAQRLVNRDDTPFTDLRFAAELLMAYGDDRQFETLAAALARFKRANEKRYGELWSAATDGTNRPERRILRLAAIVISDRRPGFGTLRYCDVAAGVVQRVSGANFGVSRQNSLQERDRAIGLAAQWLKAHHDAP